MPKTSAGAYVLVLCVIAHAALKIYTWNGPAPIWAAYLRDALFIAMFLGLLIVYGPSSILHGLQRHYSPHTRRYRAKQGFLPFVFLSCVVLPLLLYVAWTRYYRGLSSALDSSQAEAEYSQSR